MTRRIAIGGFLHESHSFAPRPTTYADFVQPAGFPRLTEGAAMLDAVRGTSVPAAGALAVAEAAGVDGRAAGLELRQSGRARCRTRRSSASRALICASLSHALDAAPLDGVYLDLHGAAVVESFPDAEGELLRRVRAIVGDLPLTISLDPHANLTRADGDAGGCGGAVPHLSACRHEGRPARRRCGCCCNASSAASPGRARSASWSSGSRSAASAR